MMSGPIARRARGGGGVGGTPPGAKDPFLSVSAIADAGLPSCLPHEGEDLAVEESCSRLLLDLRRVEERSDDRCRADADSKSRLPQLVAPFFARFLIVLIAHKWRSMASRGALEAA